MSLKMLAEGEVGHFAINSPDKLMFYSAYSNDIAIVMIVQKWRSKSDPIQSHDITW